MSLYPAEFNSHHQARVLLYGNLSGKRRGEINEQISFQIQLKMTPTLRK